MTDSGDDELVLDIGTATSSKTLTDSSAPRAPRRLPTWAAVVLALLVGWLLGTLLNSSESARDIDSTPGDPAAIADSVDEATDGGEAEVDSDETRLPEQTPPDTDRTAVVMVQAPLRGVAIPADITVIQDGISTRIDVDDELIAGVSQGVIGQGDRRMLVVGDQVVFMAFDKVMVLDPVTKAPPIEIGRAIYLFPGSDDGHVWAIGSGSQTVTSIDIAQPENQQTYSLRDIGAPLGSLRSGIVVVPQESDLGDFALWSPRAGLQPIDLGMQADFIDAAGNDIIVSTAAGLASYNVVTGELDQTNFAISRTERHRAFVSPDGARLAVVRRGPITTLPVVSVVDIATGEQIDEFPAAFEWQLQWVSNQDVMFMSPLGDAVGVMIRDTADGSTSAVTELVGPNFWVALAG